VVGAVDGSGIETLTLFIFAVSTVIWENAGAAAAQAANAANAMTLLAEDFEFLKQDMISSMFWNDLRIVKHDREITGILLDCRNNRQELNPQKAGEPIQFCFLASQIVLNGSDGCQQIGQSTIIERVKIGPST
jgi:hypothetical protein